MQHAWFGSKYAEELGYFRIYECTLVFDAQQARRATATCACISDLRTPLGGSRRARRRDRSDCAARFSPQRRAEFLRDLDFFQSLPERPDANAWFIDNGYNQSPFFTALTSPLFQRGAELPLPARSDAGRRRARAAPVPAARARLRRAHDAARGDLFLHQLLEPVRPDGRLDPALCLSGAAAGRGGAGAARAAARRRGGARARNPVPGVPRRSTRSVSALAAGYRALRQRRLPGWALPFALCYAATLLAGFAASLAVVSSRPGASSRRSWPCTARCSREYRVGLELPLVLDWPIPPGGWLPFAQKLAELHDRQTRSYLACAGALLLAALSLAPKLRSLELAILFASVALYVATPVHYYFATPGPAVLRGERRDATRGRRRAGALAALPALGRRVPGPSQRRLARPGEQLLAEPRATASCCSPGSRRSTSSGVRSNRIASSTKICDGRRRSHQHVDTGLRAVR